jgi:hypothetical protein
MGSREISAYFKDVPEFRGVYAFNSLPLYITSYPAVYVVNTDPFGSAGEHWLAIYFDRYGNAGFFDSFGHPPGMFNLHNFIQHNCNICMYNDRQVQSLFSSKCGAFCIYYLMLRRNGFSKRYVCETFSRNLVANDAVVCDYLTALSVN